MSPPTDIDPGTERINALPHQEWIDRLLACLDVPRWAHGVADQRPYTGAAELRTLADRACADLTAEEIHGALAAHPRIGERPAGTGTSASWSRTEQSGVDGQDAELAAALREGNERYEHRFGHVYLVCASGLSGRELLDVLRSRLDNDPDTELRIVGDELRKIARLRLEKVISE